MCGIAGIADPQGGPVEAGVIARMTGMIRHRGPDDSGLHCADGIGLGAARLSILDPGPAGHMPMVDEETGNWIVYNGEVYNYRELTETLGLGGLKSRTDTEVVLKAYGKLGAACVRQFNGIFGFAIWDAKRHRLFCARDRLGVKPFYYARLGGRFCFASEAKALFAAGVPRRPNMGVIHDYLAHGVYEHGTETFFEGIQQLAPGHTLTVSASGSETARFWDLNPDREAAAGGRRDEARYARACGEFGDLVMDAVRLQLRADVPVAVHTSGGLDSALIMAAINKLKGGQGDYRAFSQVYGEAAYDETPYIANLVDQLGWDVEYHRLDVAAVPDLAEEGMWQQEQPFPGIITLAKQNLIKESRPYGAKVILEGQGGDEIGAGYQYHFGPYVLDLIDNGEAERALDEIAAFGRRNGLPSAQAMAKTLSGLAAYFRPGRSADGTVATRADCLHRDFTDGAGHLDLFAAPFRSSLLNMQHRDIFHTKLPRILRSCDRASMGYGRELRVPLLDHRLVEFAFALPASFKFHDGAQRAFMRDALRTLLPTPLADVPKRAVVDPQRDWLKGPLADWVGDIISSPAFRQRGLFDAAKVAAAFAEYRERETNPNSFAVWQWVSMELWFQGFIDSAPEERLAGYGGAAPAPAVGALH